MKTLWMLLIPALFLVQTTTAQTLSVSDEMLQYEDQRYPAVHVEMSPPPKDVKKAWEDFLDENYKVKLKGIGWFSNKDVLSAEGTNFDAISSKKMNFYTKVVENGDITHMYAFGSLGYEIPLTKDEYPQSYRNMRSIVNDFLNEYLPDYYNNWVSDAEEKVSDLESDIEGLRSDIDDNEEEIADLQNEIDEWENELDDKQNQLREAERTLNDRRSSMREVNEELGQIDNK